MSNLMIPGSGAEPEKLIQDRAQQDANRDADANREARADREAGADRRQHRTSGESGDIPTEEDCLRAIAHTARLAVLGVIKPSVANVTRSSFRDILQHHKAKAKEAEKNISNGDVIDILKKDPKLLSLLEPLLSKEQIDMIMKSA